MERTWSFDDRVSEQDEKPIASFLESTHAITFGRDEDNDVTLADAWVSPWHAKIEKREEYVLVDLGSNNGIHHNGQRVAQSVRLEDDDVFAIGRHDFTFGAAGSIESVRSDGLESRSDRGVRPHGDEPVLRRARRRTGR